jgi:hypothetical protein
MILISSGNGGYSGRIKTDRQSVFILQGKGHGLVNYIDTENVLRVGYEFSKTLRYKIHAVMRNEQVFSGPILPFDYSVLALNSHRSSMMQLPQRGLRAIQV